MRFRQWLILFLQVPFFLIKNVTQIEHLHKVILFITLFFTKYFPTTQYI